MLPVIVVIAVVFTVVLIAKVVGRIVEWLIP